METQDEARSVSADEAGAQAELLPEIPVAQSAPEPENPAQEIQVDAASHAKTVESVVYHPTSVIRGYDTSEQESTVATHPVVLSSHTSAATAQQDTHEVQVAKDTATRVAPPAFDPFTPDTPAVVEFTPTAVKAPVNGDKIEAQYKGKSKWYPGVISRCRLNGTYDIAYDDGESETGVAAKLIRAKGGSSSPAKKKAADESESKDDRRPKQFQVVDAFKSRVRDTWSLMFESRYEDEADDTHDAKQEADTKPSVNTAREHTTPKKLVSSKITRPSSLRSILDLGRQLDQQLQGNRQTRVRQRPVESQQTPQTARESSTRPRKAEETWLAEEQPFQDAGLTPTIVRFCLEKATLSTVHCLAQLHAIAQNEPEPARGDVELGVFLTQWELDSILHDLFDTRKTTTAASSSSHVQMCLHNAEYASLPLETLLQVSWFMPLDQLPRVRSLVAQICRKHLSERKLAVLNAAFHRQFVLRPHPGVKMQRLLLRILDALVPKPPPIRRPNGNQADNDAIDKEAARLREESRALVVELLHAIYVRIPPGFSTASLTVEDFMRLAPLDLVTRLELTSVITVQRIVYFRFLMEALSSEKANVSVGVNSWWPRSTGKPSNTSRLHQRRASEADESTRTPQRSVAKSRKKKQPDKKTVDAKPSTEHHDDVRTEAESEAHVQSTHASHGSQGSPHQPKYEETAAAVEKASELSWSDFTTLYRSLTVALGNLVQAQPWLVDDDDAEQTAPTTASAIALRASFLAAETFRQSLVLLESTGAAASSSVLRKIQEFTDVINELPQPREASEVPPPEYADPEQPTPRRESTKAVPPPVQRGDSTSSIFPPPYVATTPSYWTFDPALPPPSTPTDTTGSSSIPRSTAKPKASPGVGDYDLARSDKLTFLQRKGFTFSKSGLEPVAESSKTPTPKRRPPHRERLNSIDSSASNEPPAYTHWASAAFADDRKTERLVIDEEDDEEEEEDVETRVREALRMQQSFALDDMVQSLLHRGHPTVSAKSKATPRPHSAASQPPSRVVSRVRTAIATARPQPQSQPPAYTKKPKKPTPPAQPITQPPRDFEPPADDAHLQWAARVSEFYQAKLKAVVASSGAS